MAKKKVSETAEVKETEVAETPVVKEKKPAKKKVAVKEKPSKEPKKPEVVKPLVTEAHASSLNVRTTPRKVRLVVDLVRGKSVKEAIAILENLNRAASAPVLKVIKSAAANATNNFNLDEDKLFIKNIAANDGMRMKRFIPRAKGSSSGIIKRSCNLFVTVAERQ
jgi:large subunit ribosomal protein L22